jgi:L-ascorbate metabolism protein UlaG (beta-lactamase superfamily)
MAGNTKYYLKPNVQMEPLVNSWHAYPFLINPATSAMVTTNYQLATMNSYIKMPKAHAAALKNPDMIGGPFIDYDGQRVEEIKSLKEEIERNASASILFAKGIKELYEILRLNAKGYPLTDIYSEIPSVLRGYVELFYDLENHPSFRFFEPLLYKSKYNVESLQSIALKAIDSDVRPFIFSTPRLKQDETLHLKLHFADERIDYLADLKRVPRTLVEIMDTFGLNGGHAETLKCFLTDTVAPVDEPFSGNGVRVRYFGHACVLLESKDVTVLVDPLISYRYPSDIARFSYDNLPEKIDYVLITHTHHDHIVIETLLQLRSKVKNVVVPRSGVGSLQDPSMKNILKSIGFKNVIEIDDLENLSIVNGSITGIPFFGEHCDLAVRSKSSYLIQFGNASFLMCADSSCINADVYQNVRQLTGRIDHLFVGLECTGAPISWAYGPLFPVPVEKKIDLARRSNGSNAAMAWDLIRIFDVKHVYLYAMGAEPWLNYFMALQHSHSDASEKESRALVEKCLSHGIAAEKLFGIKEIITG